jgi:hypothetical protein
MGSDVQDTLITVLSERCCRSRIKALNARRGFNLMPPPTTDKVNELFSALKRR